MRRSLGVTNRLISPATRCTSSNVRVPCQAETKLLGSHWSHRAAPSSSRMLWSLIKPSASTTSSGVKEESISPSDGTNLTMPSRQDKQPKNAVSDHEIQVLLDSPIGSIDKFTWIKTMKYVEYTVEQEDSPLAFRLLDRLAEEPDAPNRMTNEMVYIVVQQWLSAYARYQKTSKEFSNHIYPPSKVWRKIEGYQRLGVPLESRTLHRVIDGTALVKSRKANSPALAETILERMITWSKHECPDIRPSTFTFNAVIASWESAASLAPAKSQIVQQEAPERAMAILNRLKILHATGWGDELMPDRKTYRRVMNLFAHKGDGDQVEALLEELYGSYLERRLENLLPNSAFFSLVLYAWSKSKDPMAAERASTILDRILEMEKNKEIPGLVVTASCFNICMNIFDRMVALSKSDRSKIPIAGSYAALIHTWSWWDPKKAEEAFWMWKREHNAGNCEMRMDSILFCKLIAGWFNSKAPDSAKRCDKLLQYALDGNLGDAWEPTVVVFNMVINSYARTKKIENIESAEIILRQMETLRETSKQYRLLGPALSSYVPIIHAFSHLGQVESAEALLREWFDRASDMEKAKGVESFTKKKQLDTKTFNHVLKAWVSKTPILSHAADRSEDLLLSMNGWGVNPNITSFQYVLDCRKRIQSRSAGQRNAKSRNDEILVLLDREHKKGRLGADEDSYLTLRKEWSIVNHS